MSEVQNQVICGFVPPYILEAAAGSESIAQESRSSCKHTLQYAQSYLNQRHDLRPESHAPIEKEQAAQQALGTAKAAPATSVQRKIYDCKETGKLPGTLVRSEGQTRIKDRQVNNCYDGFKITHDFFSNVFGRNSLDDKGLPLTGSVHYKPRDTPNGYNNAYWDGEANRMVFGDGDHITFDYLTDSLDVIAHELSHGFVQYSSPLLYQSQSGALNESCADVFGSMVEQWHMRQTVDDADWILGQTLFPVAFTGSALRSLKAGKAYTDDPVFGTDPQPKHMDDIYEGPDDYEGVHYNSGIPSHAFYLAAKSLGGNSWDKAGKVWYKTMTSGKIPFKCDFKTFANVTVELAGDEFEDDSVQKAIREAWVKVGVLDGAVAE